MPIQTYNIECANKSTCVAKKVFAIDAENALIKVSVVFQSGSLQFVLTDTGDNAVLTAGYDALKLSTELNGKEGSPLVAKPVSQ